MVVSFLGMGFRVDQNGLMYWSPPTAFSLFSPNQTRTDVGEYEASLLSVCVSHLARGGNCGRCRD